MTTYALTNRSIWYPSNDNICNMNDEGFGCHWPFYHIPRQGVHTPISRRIYFPFFESEKMAENFGDFSNIGIEEVAKMEVVESPIFSKKRLVISS